MALIAIFGGVSSFVEVESYIDALTMVAAIMGGSFLYWFVVSQFIATIRHRLDVVRLGQINRIAGLVLIGFGVRADRRDGVQGSAPLVTRIDHCGSRERRPAARATGASGRA